MRHSLWWLLGQFALVAAGGTVIILAVIAVWYGLSFMVLTAVGRIFPLRGGKWRPADYDPTGGASGRGKPESAPAEATADYSANR
jgi:hypothetical protein